MDNLKLEKLKTETMLILAEARYNHNHDAKGRFAASSGGSGSNGSGSSISYKKADDTTQAKHQAAIKELSQDKYNDGTYDLDSLEPTSYKDGYQFTFSQIGDNYSDSEYAEKVNEFLAASSDGKTSAGKFESAPEVSFHCKDKNTAIKLAKKYNQISIWDWEAGDTIDTGGTGKR